MSHRSALVSAIALAALGAPLAQSQTLLPAPSGKPRPAFEVASVKWIDRDKMQGNHEGHELSAQRFVDRTELIQFISMAYFRGGVCALKTVLGWDCPYIVGSLPEWVKNDRYEIQAKIPAHTIPSYTEQQLSSGDTPEIHLMLQSLLEERFQLRVHRERRDLAVYALTAGKNVSKLRPSAPGSELRTGADGSVHEVHGSTGIRRVAATDGASRIQLTFRAGSMARFVEVLGQSLDLPVLDRTGISGEYDFVIEYEEERGQRGAPPTGLLPGATGGALSVALQDIGLKLESAKAPVEVLVIDHVERPSQN